MIFFWVLYLVIALIMSYSISFLFKKRFLKVFFFSFSLSLMISIWYKIPGENYIAPIITVFLLENTILDDNGVIRLLSPLLFSTLIIFFVTLLIWKKKPKS